MFVKPAVFYLILDRRADGVLLLYDCTYENSFLNVRDWISAVEVCTYYTVFGGNHVIILIEYTVRQLVLLV